MKNSSYIAPKKSWKSKIIIIGFLVILFLFITNNFSQSNQPSETDIRISEIVQKLQDANLQIGTLHEQNSKLTDENKNLAEKLQEANLQIASLQSQTNDLNQKLQSSNAQVTDLQKKNSQLENSMTENDDFYALAERIRQEIASTGKGTLIIETTTDDELNAETSYSIDLSNAPTSSTITNSEIVYITDTGDKYHRDGCRYLRESKHEISRNNAVSQGYTPCSVCKP